MTQVLTRVPDSFHIIATSVAKFTSYYCSPVGDQVEVKEWGCTYKEFLSCNPKEYNGKGGAVVYILWIEKMESVQDMSGCGDNRKVKYTTGSFAGKALTWWNSQIHTRSHEVVVDRFHKLARLVPHLVTPANKRIERYVYGLAPQIRGMVAAMEPSTIQKDVQIADTLTNEALRNGSFKKNHEKRGNRGEPSKRFGCRMINKRTRLDNSVFSITVMGTTVTDQAGSDIYVGAEEGSRGTQSIVTGIKPNDLGFSYEIKIASGKLVEIDKVIKGCKLEIEGHEFDINLIPFRSGRERPDKKVRHLVSANAKEQKREELVMERDFGVCYLHVKQEGSLIPLSCGSFDVIVGMNWLSKRKFVIVCHEKVVRIALEGDEILRVHGEHTQGAVKTLMNTKFRIDLVHGATPVVKSPYRLAPSEMQELSEQLRELQYKVVDALSRKGSETKTSNSNVPRLSVKLRKERVKPRRVRAMAMTIQYGVRRMILAAQSEAFKQENVRAERLHSLRYLSKNEIESPWMLSVNLQGQSSEYDVIWVMVDRLTKLAHLLAIQEDFKM
ncbi:hypothetical protein Tco_0975487 [Tanacetum coccineum]|uniref:Reverse transcriptase domain-containing protein n=1 Tax=Tanacetum coccineum TaxID=301880 RepID=A0ABQ5EEH4_9ASTR